VLRTQQGKFVGCTMNFPPANLNLPDFPPLPAPPKTNSPSAVVVKPAPKVVVPPLVIVGEEVGTNLNAVSKPPAPPPVPAPVVPTNPPAPATNRAVAAKQPEPLPTNTVVVPVVSNVLPPPATNQPPAMAVTQAVMPAVPPPAVNHVASPADTKNGERQTGVLVIIGAGLFLLAVVLAGFLIRSGRRPRSSLITSSMQEPPPRK
jgi:fused signal recognition particle receptor